MAERDFTTLRAEDWRDIQGIILLDYGMPLVRHLLVKIEQPHEARHLLGTLADQSETHGVCITTSDSGQAAKKRDYCLNVGLTYQGLQALDLPEHVVDSFASTPSFVAGAAARAWHVGDTGKNAPESWWTEAGKAGPEESHIHMLFSLYVQGDHALLEKKTDELKKLFQANGREILRVLYQKDGACLDDPYPHKPGSLVHFGFKDGISQPQINGAPPAGPGAYPGQATVSPGAFLFGYPSQWADFRYPVPRPDQFGRNGSFAVFRIMQQHVGQFADYLKAQAQLKNLSEDEVAALLCGRSRNGDPLVAPRSPYVDDFDYATDPDGKACPFASHIRRTNPRGDRVAGDDAKKHPIIRRGMPYGPAHDPSKKDNEERGLIGLFIGVSIEDQFEFIMQTWVNQGGFRQGLPGAAADPLLPFIRTRGCVYCFLPSITALAYIASV
jgi:Dyp-type peroxidase family